MGDEPITYEYQWIRCDKEGNSCKAIGGKTQTSYKVAKNDVGKTLRFGVRAKNSRGTADAFSVQTDVVQDATGGGGVIVLPDGTKSVDVKDVPKGERLIVDKVVFSPSLVTSATDPIVTHIRVTDTRGYVVRNAIVFIRSTPKVTSGGDNSPTATDGWVTYVLYPEKDIVIKTGYSTQFFVKAYRKGDPTLAGISGSRLVQVATQS